MKPNITQDYKSKFLENLRFYFDATKVLTCVNFEFVHNAWSLNFEEYSQSSILKMKAHVMSLIKTEDLDQFLRSLKVFYINNSKRLYSLLLDYILTNCVSNPTEIKSKKDIFRFISD